MNDIYQIIHVSDKKCHLKLLNAELNPISQLLALLGAHHILYVSRIMVNGVIIANAYISH